MTEVPMVLDPTRCPFDTNGDGDCGRPLCPFCGPDASESVVLDQKSWMMEDHEEWWMFSTDVPYGTCWCGCGLETPLASKNRLERFHIEGKPVRYLHGHGGRRSEPVDGKLQCRRCHLPKPVEDFYDNGHRKNLPHARKYQTICKDCIRIQTRERKYDLSDEEYTDLFLSQQGRCGICGEELDLEVDHHHESGLARGLLCGGCNKGLGHFAENSQALRNAARYVSSHPIQVLDKGYVQLVDVMGNDLSVVNSARVSFNITHQFMEQGDDKLIEFLMKNRHGTPFEAAVFQFRIKCPLFVAREWQRHRIGSYNEFSTRYAEMPMEFYEPEKWRTQVGKPGAYRFQDASPRQQVQANTSLLNAYAKAEEAYRWLLELDVAREMARLVLPLATYTEFYWTCNARSLMNFLSLRNSEHAQFEIRQYAIVIENEIFLHEMPITCNAFNHNGRVAP